MWGITWQQTKGFFEHYTKNLKKSQILQLVEKVESQLFNGKGGVARSLNRSFFRSFFAAFFAARSWR